MAGTSPGTPTAGAFDSGTVGRLLSDTKSAPRGTPGSPHAGGAYFIRYAENVAAERWPRLLFEPSATRAASLTGRRSTRCSLRLDAG